MNPDDPAGPKTPIDARNAEYIGITACTSATTPCAPGTLGRFTARTPRLNNFDGTLTKSIRIAERLHMEFKMEAFNIFNHRQYGTRAISPFDAGSTITISANVFTSPAGRFLNPGFADGGARVIRYGLKFIF